MWQVRHVRHAHPRHVTVLERFQCGELSRTVQLVAAEQATQLDDADALGGHRHDDAGEARLRFAQLERVHGVARSRKLLSESLQAERVAGRERIAAELGAEGRVEEQSLDELRGAGRLVPVSG
jgi:hypothetical protein